MSKLSPRMSSSTCSYFPLSGFFADRCLFCRFSYPLSVLYVSLPIFWFLLFFSTYMFRFGMFDITNDKIFPKNNQISIKKNENIVRQLPYVMFKALEQVVQVKPLNFAAFEIEEIYLYMEQIINQDSVLRDIGEKYSCNPTNYSCRFRCNFRIEMMSMFYR